MALRDQPYLPLYVQDFLTDEKLNNCSPATQGVYIKIMCILHKQENYGKLLLKPQFKQKSSIVQNFALAISRQLPFSLQVIEEALQELVSEKVLTIEGDEIYQSRMVKDFQKSKVRSEAAKKGGGNPILFKQKDKLQDKLNRENEYEYDNEIEINNIKGGMGGKEKKVKRLHNVETTELEDSKLRKDYGSELTDEAYDYLSNYKIEKGYKTKSDYLTIRRWVITAIADKKNKSNATHQPVLTTITGKPGTSEARVEALKNWGRDAV